MICSVQLLFRKVVPTDMPTSVLSKFRIFSHLKSISKLRNKKSISFSLVFFDLLWGQIFLQVYCSFVFFSSLHLPFIHVFSLIFNPRVFYIRFNKYEISMPVDENDWDQLYIFWHDRVKKIGLWLDPLFILHIFFPIFLCTSDLMVLFNIKGF